jgi:molybdopterin-guanine dinucleotide biosynthesis protein A
LPAPCKPGRTKPASQRILISANRHLDAYAAYGHPVLPDSLPDYPGPLAGLLAGMQAAPDSHLLMLPCDAVCAGFCRPPAGSTARTASGQCQ